ncbi:MAG: DNA translocase FtsK 4TM domain-containing protein, partial [Candidatus Margulisiibacteriota bacterium]
MPPKSRNKRKVKEDKPKREIPSKFKQDIVGILLLALAVFVFVSNQSTLTGLVGYFAVKTVLRSALGIGVYVLPFFIGLYGIILLLRHEVKELTVRLIGLLVIFLAYITVAQYYAPNYFLDAEAIYFQGAGGIIGFGTEYALMRTVGIWGSYIILSALALIGILMVLNVTVLNVVTFIYHILKPEREEEEKEKVKAKAKAEGKKTIAAQFPLIKEMPTELEVIPAPPPPEPEHKPVVEFPLPKFETEETSSKVKVVSSDAPKKRYSKYKLPSIDLLDEPTAKEKQQAEKLQETTELRRKLLEEALRNFGVGARVVSIFQGPAVTRFELQPEPGVKVSRIANLADDIALNLAAHGVRIEAPVPGKSVVGIEVPNATVTPVRLKEIVKTKGFQNNPSKLFISIGEDLSGAPIFGDLSKMPHLLIAGTTGSGKSVCINSL